MVDVRPGSRFKLSATQLSSAFSLAGLAISPLIDSGTLPKVSDAEAGLAGSAALGQDGRGLLPELTRGLEALAEPVHRIVCSTCTVGSAVWREQRWFHSAAGNGCFTSIAKDGGTFDIEVMPDGAAAIGHLFAGLKLHDALTGREAVSAILDGDGLAALAAAADAAQTMRLRTRLERMAEVHPILTASLLEREWMLGIGRPDTRWMVSVLQSMGPIQASESAPPMASGLTTLEKSGLVRSAQRGWSFTTAGLEYAQVFGNLDALARIVVSIRRAQQWSELARFALCNGGGRTALFRGSKDNEVATIEVCLDDVANVLQRLGDDVVAACATASKLETVNKPKVKSKPETEIKPRTVSKPETANNSDSPGTPQQARSPKTATRPPKARQPAKERPPKRLSEPAISAEVPSERRCVNANCGAVLALGKKFCTVCGTPVPKGAG